jgi:hypothetical protein
MIKIFGLAFFAISSISALALKDDSKCFLPGAFLKYFIYFLFAINCTVILLLFCSPY